MGNLEDISARAVRVLSEVDFIACEDTRYSGRMLQTLNVRTPCIALHEHNERQLCADLIERLQGGQSAALISDAGTPLISDPGYHLVRAAHEAGCRVVPVPGPNAAVSALSVSGLPSDHFVFEGFLPAKQSARRSRLTVLRAETRTLIFYESPHRIIATLRDMVEVFGDQREATFVREMTKVFETIRKDTLLRLSRWVNDDAAQRLGEIVLVIRGAAEELADKDKIFEVRRVLEVLLGRLPLKEAVALATQITGERRNQVYALAIELAKE
jgi:16S rRNA (cytidine1402-2'-O)-methyltransferase